MKSSEKMQLPKIDPLDVVVILGKRKSGKTTILKRIINEQWNRCPYIIYDPNGEYGAHGLVCANSRDLKLAIKMRQKHIVFQPVKSGMNAHDYLCALVWFAQGYSIITDEADDVQSSHKIGDYHSQEIRRGRHRGSGLIEIARKTQWLNPLVPSNAKHFFIFKHFYPPDVEYLSRFLPPAVLEQVQQLPVHTCLYYCPEDETVRIGMSK